MNETTDLAGCYSICALSLFLRHRVRATTVSHFLGIQWNLPKADTIGAKKIIHFIEMSLL